MKNIEQRKRAILASVQKGLNFHISPEVKEVIDEQAGEVYCEEDLEYYKASVTDLVKLAKLVAMSGYIPLPPRKKRSLNSKRNYPGPFQKRLYLVNFVINHQLGLRRNNSINRHRINWRQTCEAWNTANPCAPITPPVLKATYYRAIAEEDIQRECFHKNDSDIGVKYYEFLKGRIEEIVMAIGAMEKSKVYLNLEKESGKLKIQEGISEQVKENIGRGEENINRALEKIDWVIEEAKKQVSRLAERQRLLVEFKKLVDHCDKLLAPHQYQDDIREHQNTFSSEEPLAQIDEETKKKFQQKGYDIKTPDDELGPVNTKSHFVI